MPIEITGPGTPKAGNTSEGTQTRMVRNEGAGAQKQAGAATPRDTVSLTDTAALLQRLDADIAALPIVDVTRIDAIKQKIADGSFHIDPVRVAEKLIQSEVALQGRA